MEKLSMKEKEEIDWDARMENLLTNIELTEVNFQKKSGATTTAHEKVLEVLRDEWSKCKQPVMEERAFQIDFVGRSFPRHGKIELALEVDTWHKPLGNWVKLLDINATTKMWIYIRREKDRADERFQEALKEFRKLAAYRMEDKTNNVIIFMKVAGEKTVKKCYLFE